MKVNVEEVSPVERKLSIEVEKERVEEELNRAYDSLGRHVKIAGFRPGKVPRRLLQQRFKDEVEGDVIRKVVERAYLEAIREHNVEAVANPQVTPEGGLKPNEPFRFQARVEVKPKVEPKDYSGVPLQRRELKVDDQKVTERLEQLRQNLSRLEPVERDVAQAGDFAVIDFEATVDGAEFPGSKAENVQVELAPGELVESKIAALEGVKVGDTKEVDYAFPPDYQVEQVKGKTGHFKVRLKGLKVRIVPELNDDLAKEVQGGQTLDELKTRIRTDLEKAEKNKAESDDREALFKALVERNPFEVPKAMVERAIDMMLDGALRMMARSGVDPRALNLDFTRLREEMREKATLEVKGTLLLEAIAEREKIQTTDEDLEKRMEELAGDTQQALSQIRKHFRDPDQRRNLQLRLREEKTIEFLKASATYS